MADKEPQPAKRKPGRPRKNPPPPPPPPLAPPPPPPEDLPLDDTEQRFLDEYMIDQNRTRAYHVIAPGCSYRNAARSARHILSRPHVRAELLARQQAGRIRCQIRADRVLRELGWLAHSDIGEIFDDQNRLIP